MLPFHLGHLGPFKGSARWHVKVCLFFTTFLPFFSPSSPFSVSARICLGGFSTGGGGVMRYRVRQKGARHALLVEGLWHLRYVRSWPRKSKFLHLNERNCSDHCSPQEPCNRWAGAVHSGQTSFQLYVQTNKSDWCYLLLIPSTVSIADINGERCKDIIHRHNLRRSGSCTKHIKSDLDKC